MLENIAFKTVADRLADAVVATDAEGRIVWTNEAFFDLCGFPPDSIVGRKPGSFLRRGDADPETGARVGAAIRRGEAVDAELLNYHKDGRAYWVSLRITPLHDESGKLTGFVAIEREITDVRDDRHQLEQQLVEMYSTLLRLVESE